MMYSLLQWSLSFSALASGSNPAKRMDVSDPTQRYQSRHHAPPHVMLQQLRFWWVPGKKIKKKWIVKKREYRSVQPKSS